MRRLIIPLATLPALVLALALPVAPATAETPSQITDRIKRDNPRNATGAHMEGGRLIVGSKAPPSQAEKLGQGACADTSPRDVRRVEVIDPTGRKTASVDCTKPLVRLWGN